MKYHITTNLQEMDFELIHGFLTESYWSKGISKAVLKKAFDNSLCFAILKEDQHKGAEQLGFARMITDRSTFAYLADVFILPEYRGQGLSKQLMEYIINHSDLQGLRRMMLATADAHELYKKFGFTALSDEKLFMESWDPDVYKSSLKKKYVDSR